MKRAAPSEEPEDVSSDDSLSLVSGDEARKGNKGRSASGVPKSSKPAAAAEDEGYSDSKRAAPGQELQEVSSDDSLSSDSDDETGMGKSGNAFGLPSFSKPAAPVEGAMIRRAEMYQQYMKHIPVPPYQGSLILFTSWMGLGRSMKQLYEQPFHYLTNVLLKRWDQQRIGSDDEHRRLDAIIDPVRAETLIWATEDVHRLTTSGCHLARLWASDPMYHAYIDPVFPSIKLD